MLNDPGRQACTQPRADNFIVLVSLKVYACPALRVNVVRRDPGSFFDYEENSWSTMNRKKMVIKNIRNLTNKMIFFLVILVESNIIVLHVMATIFQVTQESCHLGFFYIFAWCWDQCDPGWCLIQSLPSGVVGESGLHQIYISQYYVTVNW